MLSLARGPWSVGQSSGTPRPSSDGHFILQESRPPCSGSASDERTDTGSPGRGDRDQRELHRQDRNRKSQADVGRTRSNCRRLGRTALATGLRWSPDGRRQIAGAERARVDEDQRHPVAVGFEAANWACPPFCEVLTPSLLVWLREHCVVADRSAAWNHCWSRQGRPVCMRLRAVAVALHITCLRCLKTGVVMCGGHLHFAGVDARNSRVTQELVHRSARFSEYIEVLRRYLVCVMCREVSWPQDFPGRGLNFSRHGSNNTSES